MTPQERHRLLIENYQGRIADVIGADKAAATVAGLRKRYPDEHELSKRVGDVMTQLERGATETLDPEPVEPADSRQVAELPAEPKPSPLTRGKTGRRWKRDKVRAAWKARRRGHISKEIYIEEGYAMLIRCVNGRVRAAMSKTVLLAFLACSEEADYDGQFEMPAGRLGDLIGCNRNNARLALEALLAAGVIRLIEQGGPRVANLYSLTPARAFDEARAIKAFEQTRLKNAERIEAETSRK